MLLSPTQLGAIAAAAVWTGTGVIGRPEAPVQPWVVLVSLDTVRADALGSYGGRARTPHLDALAAEAIRFTKHFSAAPTTLASHAALFTGTWPHTHGVPRNGFRLDAENRTLAEILGDQGHDTAGFIGAAALEHATGISQGFVTWDEPTRSERPGAEVVDHTLDWLDRRDPSDKRPVFLFVHFYDAHAPYTSPPGYLPDSHLPTTAAHPGSNEHIGEVRAECAAHTGPWREEGRVLEERYLAGVSWLDHQTGRLFAGLAQRGVLPGALLVVTSDHGEAFDAHEECWDHGHTVYDETTRVPLLIQQPGLGSGVCERLASNIDVLPSVLELLGLPDEASAEGMGFAPTLRGQPQAGRGVVFSEATKPFAENPPGWPNADRPKAARSSDARLIWDPLSDRRQLFLTGQDASESVDRWANLADAPPVRALDLSLGAWAAAPSGRPTQALDNEATDAALRALGYAE